MPLTRAYEEHEVSPDLRHIYSDVRAAFDLPYVPTIFKLSAGNPEYMKAMWRDLEHVAGSREFQSASAALDEFIRSQVITGGWRFGDQERTLAGQKIPTGDIGVLAAVVGVFARAMPRMVLFSRLMQRGYSGGQRGRVSTAKQSPALSRLVTLHIPNESEAGMRVWLLFSDVRRATGTKHIPSAFRALIPFPGYLAQVWMDTKKVFAEPSFLRARDEVMRRSMGLITGMPVRDHRNLVRNVSPEQWREIEELVDGFARLLPQFAMLIGVWQRSFAIYSGRYRAA
ncbi:MAG TPA: halocarboxylic acid dehydrogenase DehI family protein [Clostridia bacterium]|nr:halocarboxylic acid dehydrogenase DehI family protein [Clostridia bacterium]